MDFISQLQVQLAILQSYLEELHTLQQKQASREEAMALFQRMRKQREVSKKLVAKSLEIAGMRDVPVVCSN